MLICRKAEGVHGQRKVGNPCTSQWFRIFGFRVEKMSVKVGVQLPWIMTVALQLFPSLLAMFHTPEKILSRVFEFVLCQYWYDATAEHCCFLWRSNASHSSIDHTCWWTCTFKLVTYRCERRACWSHTGVNKIWWFHGRPEKMTAGTASSRRLCVFFSLS